MISTQYKVSVGTIGEGFGSTNFNRASYLPPKIEHSMQSTLKATFLLWAVLKSLYDCN